MSALDIDSLLRETSPEKPSGENLEYDPAFAELVRLAQGTPEQQMGESVRPAVEPDWRAIKSKAPGLLARSKDIRLAVYLTQALLRTDGFGGLGDGLALIHGLLDGWWDTLHPQLDPEDDNDPTMRVNTLVALCDSDAMLRPVRETPLVSSRAIGRFSLKDVLVATGQLPAPASGDPPPEASAIDAAVRDADLKELQATASALGRAFDLIGAVETVLTDKVGATRAADFSDLANLFKQASKVVNEWLVRRGVGTIEEGPGGGGTAGPGGGGGQPMTGSITSRDDVMRVLDKVCDYFAQHEPSSPVPLLLRRAKGLVSKDFLEIVRNLAPDGLAQVEAIRGASGEDS